MLNTILAMIVFVLNTSAFALDTNLLDPLKRLEMKSADLISGHESCEDVIVNHIAIVDDSEQYISSLVDKKSIELTAYEITMLQKILTNRFLHLSKAFSMYRDSDSKAECSPRLMGNAIAIYDFTELGRRALNDSKLRRIILNFTKSSKNKLTRLKELYDYYTSNEVIMEFQQQISEENILLPESLLINNERLASGSFYALSDMALSGTSTVVSGASRVLGFISDRLKWRNGRLFGNAEALDRVSSQLKPLDLIYETRKYTLSNYTIPGHWGHVAVWLGTKDELVEMGIWDKPTFSHFRRYVEEGKNIIEIRKTGMNAVSLADYINLDEIAITRITAATKNAESIYKELAEQIDKKYDFAFNAQSTDKLTCSEFIAFSYGDIRWPETKALFQISISPDDLATLTLYKNSPAEFVLYLKGKKDGTFEDKNFYDWSKLFEKKIKEEMIYN